MPQELSEALPDPIKDVGIRVTRLFKALGVLIDIPGVKGIADCQYLRAYKGPLLFEKALKQVLIEPGKFWEQSYQEVIRTASSTKLVAGKLTQLEKDLGTDLPLGELVKRVPAFAEVKAAMRKGSVEHLEVKIHQKLIGCGTQLLDGSGSLDSMANIDALIAALRGHQTFVWFHFGGGIEFRI